MARVAADAHREVQRAVIRVRRQRRGDDLHAPVQQHRVQAVSGRLGKKSFRQRHLAERLALATPDPAQR
ncbi:MAG: hypothetical protein IPJ28_15310, partial [Betaproteobacteria bacterium]|nr:hypothetical protein [Betaproteobacteria bacterium]